MVIFAFLQIGQLLPMTIGGNVTTRLIDNQGTLTRLCNTSGRPSAGFIPTRSLALPSHPYGKAVKLAFIPACGRLLPWRGRYASNHASLAPVH